MKKDSGGMVINLLKINLGWFYFLDAKSELYFLHHGAQIAALRYLF
jgi:hypothetical protein